MFEPAVSYESILESTRLGKREYQIRLGTKAIAMFAGTYRNGGGELENAARSIAIESPTGSGKTPMALCIAKTMQANLPGLQVIWVSMRKNLLTQADRENRDQNTLNPDGKGINADVKFLSMFASNLPDECRPEFRGDRRLLFIHDEMQHDATASAAHLHNELRPDYVLGVSAFPQRTDRIKLAFERTIRDSGIHELIQAGYLSKYDHYTIPDWSPTTVSEFYLADPQRWGSSLVFFNTLEQCDEFSRLVNAGGKRCETVNADTDRERQIEDLKSGALDVLVNCAILTEGANLPDLKTVFCRDSWRGSTTQQAGRIFRISKLNPRKQIVQSKATPWPIVRTATPEQSFVWRNGGWLTLKINENVDRVIEETRMTIAHAENTVPKMLQDVAKGGRRRAKRF